MAKTAFGGILSGLMQGFDYQNEVNRRERLDREAADDRAYQRSRMQRADMRAETEFENQQADRAHMLERRPVLEAREDEDYGLQSAIRKLQLKRGIHDVERMPIEDQQRDAEFALNQQAKRQSIAEGGQRLSLNKMRMELEKMGLDQAKIDQARKQAEEALLHGFAAGRMTGDWSRLAHAYNATIARTHGGQPIAITQNEDGSFTVANGSGAMKFADQNHLFQAVGAIVDPKLYMQDLYASMTRSDEPAAIKETNAIFQRLQPIEGEDDNARWMRAFAMRSARAGESPQDSAAGFYKTLVKDAGMKPDKAMEATRTFMETFYPNARGPWNAGQQQVQPVFAGPGTGVAPPPRFAQPAPAPAPRAPAPQPRVVRYGTMRDGTRVAQLEDGTIVPVQ
jgi:hypothetical protein